MIAPLKIQPTPDLDARLAFAACAFDGRCFIGWRHDLILRDDIKPRGLYMTQECQGFVDDRGCFWSRDVSAQIAYRARQIARPAEVIMSEELWDPDGTPRDGWKPDPSRVATPAPREADDVKLCPCCQTNDTETIRRFQSGTGEWQEAVRCNNCGISGPLASWQVRAHVPLRATPPGAPVTCQHVVKELQADGGWLCYHCRALLLSAAPVAVTAEMVHAALRAFYPYTNPAINSGTPDIDRMRAALAAAASAAPKGT